MKLKISLFGPFISKFGRGHISVYIDGTTCEVREIKKIVLDMFPNIRGLNFKVVVNQEICDDDHTVNEGDEVAFLPPISGGAYSYLTKRKITESFMKQASNYQDSYCGSTLVFVGRVRKDRTFKKENVYIQQLEYSAYLEMAEKEIDKIIQYTKKTFGVKHIVVKHRIGKVKLGEIAFLVVVFSPHRKEGNQAIDYIIDQVKSKVPIWKKEIYSDGTAKWQEGVMIK